MQNFVFVPIRNKKCTLIPRIPLQLDCGLRIGNFEPDHYGRIVRFDPRGMEEFSPQHKGLVADPTCVQLSAHSLDDWAKSIFFALNFSAKEGALIPSVAYSAVKRKALIVTQKNNIDGSFASLSKLPSYVLSENYNARMIDILFQKILRGLSRDRTLHITIRRFNSSILSDDPSSRIIDLAICLESLFPFDSEISFRFSLLGAVISTSDSAKRKQNFSILRDLYKARSAFVHGTEIKNTTLERVTNELPTLLQIVKLCILRKLDFLSEEPTMNWKDHIDDVALGASSIEGVA